MIELYELAGQDPALRFSPYCWRIRMALAHKGLHARLIAWHFGEKRLPGGNTQVPVLVDGGQVIADSTAIARYLEEAYPTGPSLFGCEAGEAHASFIMAWTDQILQPALFPLVAPDLVQQIKPEALAAWRAVREQRLGMSLDEAAGRRDEFLHAAHAAMGPLRTVLASQPFLGGTEPTYADYAVFGAFQWVRCGTGREILAEDDPIFAWRDQLLDLFDGLAGDADVAEAA
jgi:glutathione S-transferase